MRAGCASRARFAPAAACTRPHRHTVNLRAMAPRAEPDVDPPDQENLRNKLNLPPDALQHVARGWQAQSSRSDVPVDLLAAVADLPMTDGTRSPDCCVP